MPTLGHCGGGGLETPLTGSLRSEALRPHAVDLQGSVYRFDPRSLQRTSQLARAAGVATSPSIPVASNKSRAGNRHEAWRDKQLVCPQLAEDRFIRPERDKSSTTGDMVGLIVGIR